MRREANDIVNQKHQVKQNIVQLDEQEQEINKPASLLSVCVRACVCVCVCVCVYVCVCVLDIVLFPL